MSKPVHPIIALPQHDETVLRMGNILCDLGKLTSADVERIVESQKDLGLQFGEVARRLGLISEADVRQVLARQFDYHYLQPDQADFPPELVAAYQPFSPQAETLRAVRTQLMQRWFGLGHKALAIVSVNSGEGVSTFSANLAIAFSQLGEHTLLVDANLRQPRQQQLFRLGSKSGLSDILAGRAGMEAFARIEAFSDLHVLQAGTLPPNPQELLSRASFDTLSESLALRFDVILLDVPAFSTGADALAIASRTGGVLLICRKDRTCLADLSRARVQLSRAGAEVVGSVLVEF